MGTATGAGIVAEIRGDPMRPHKSPSKKEAGLDASRHTRVSPGGQGEEFFLDILFHRMSVMMGILQQLTKSCATFDAVGGT